VKTLTVVCYEPCKATKKAKHDTLTFEQYRSNSKMALSHFFGDVIVFDLSFRRYHSFALICTPLPIYCRMQFHFFKQHV